jgi:PHD/YefM family antitoxin component YafN of YafNO toxin-antitoxin module
MTTKRKWVSVSELKQSPARVMDMAHQTGQPVGIVRNNELQGYYVPNDAFELIAADSEQVRTAVDKVINDYGDALTWLAKN